MSEAVSSSENAVQDDAMTREDLFQDIAEALEGDKVFYEMLARFFFSPLTQEEVDSLAVSGFDAYNNSAEDDLLARGFREMDAYLKQGGSGMRQRLNVDYTSAFYGVNQYEGKVATPYESVFRSATGLLNQESRGEVFRFYKKEAIRLKEGIDLPDDHLSFELQFMGILCQRAADALRGGRAEEALETITKLNVFLEDHILTWIEDCFEVARTLLTTGFYRGLLNVTTGYMEVSHAALAEMIDALKETIGTCEK